MSARQDGQALVLVLAALVALLAGTLVLGGVAAGIGAHGDHQRAADLAALSAAGAMRAAFPRVFEPADRAGHLERAAYLALGARAARDTARRNGMVDVRVAFPGGGLAPVRVRVVVRDPIRVGHRAVASAAVAEAELAPPGSIAGDGAAGAGEYRGPLATRQGQRMRPDVALAFDRMAAA
ncbi:MAG: hypothetical protein ACXVFT_13105, partial [Solirubrobacteraceae bacterium]